MDDLEAFKFNNFVHIHFITCRSK